VIGKNYDDSDLYDDRGAIRNGAPALTVVRDDQPSAVHHEQHRGQMRMAERLAMRYDGRLLHAHGLGWYLWDSKRWAPDKDGGALRCAIDTVKAALRECVDLDGKDRDALYSDVRKVETASGLEGMLRIAGSLEQLTAAAECLDGDPHLFNCADGTLDLLTGSMRPHDPADRITKMAGCGLADNPGEVFPRFLEEVLPDREVREFVQRLIGYAMLGKTPEHILPIFTGTGRNGKSTLLNAVMEAFGDYAISADPDLLIERGNSHPTGQADLLGVRLATTAETDEGRQLAAATVKRLTGGDKIRARRMRKDFFEFNPSHTLVMVTNHKPKVSGDDPALWRRIRVIPFDVVVDADKVDPRLPERLSAELPAVLAWAYDGCRAYAEAGSLAAPAAVQERTAAYQASSDALGRFLADRTIKTSQGVERARDLFSAWMQWCHENGEPTGSEQEFSESMDKRGHTKKRRSSGQVYLGLILAADEVKGP
jgi:putative DNA primase/helicase